MYTLNYASSYQYDHPGHGLKKKVLRITAISKSPCSTFFNSFFPPLLAGTDEHSLWSAACFFSLWKKLAKERTWIRDKTETDYTIVVLTLSTLQLLRPTEPRADSFASMPCWWCCSCSLWICSLIFRASWMAFNTVSWSPNSAVEFRLDRISIHT